MAIEKQEALERKAEIHKRRTIPGVGSPQRGEGPFRASRFPAAPRGWLLRSLVVNGNMWNPQEASRVRWCLYSECTSVHRKNITLNGTSVRIRRMRGTSLFSPSVSGTRQDVMNSSFWVSVASWALLLQLRASHFSIGRSDAA
jgi:hypothetical protein